MLGRGEGRRSESRRVEDCEIGRGRRGVREMVRAVDDEKEKDKKGRG